MQTLSIDKYNKQQTAKWNADWDKASKDGNYFNMPQLAFYIFDKSYGYVAFEGSRALWAKSKKAVIAWWEDEEAKKKVRGW